MQTVTLPVGHDPDRPEQEVSPRREVAASRRDP